MNANVLPEDRPARENARDRLALSEALVAAIHGAAFNAIVSIDQQGVIQTINPATEALFGYREDELIGRNVKLLMPSPYREQHDGFLARYLATGEKRIIGVGREVVGLRKNGTTFPMELAVAEARLDNERVFVGIVRDITERKQAEDARFLHAAIVESSDDAIVGKTLDGTITSWNAGAERIYGYSAAEALGRPITLITLPDRPDEVPALLDRIKRGERVDHYDTVRSRKDGQRIEVSLTISPIKVAGGEILGASAISRDITEQKRANEEIRAMTQQLWHSAKLASVGELAASIAHELNNPLATVSLRIESALARTPADDPRRKALEIIAHETQRMGELVANLLQFARRGPEQISTVGIGQELSKAVELIHYHLRNRRITIAQDFAPDTPVIYTDRQKLRQVFLNLLTNAIDAMPEGGTVTLRTAPATLDNRGAAVLIEFEDTGVGIPAEHLEKIMEPFFTTKEEGKGTGLGLPICRRVVEEQHGTIKIASEVGKGTIVRLVLPIRNGANVDYLGRRSPASSDQRTDGGNDVRNPAGPPADRR